MRTLIHKPIYLDSVNDNTTVYGILNPLLWDREGKPSEYSIYTDAEEDIIIDSSYPKKNLKKLSSKRVEAVGKIGFDEEGNKILRPKKIREIKGPLSSAATVSVPPSTNLWEWEFPVCLPKNYQNIDDGPITPLWKAS